MDLIGNIIEHWLFLATVFEADNLLTMLENWSNSCKVHWSGPEMSYYKSRGFEGNDNHSD